MFDFSPQREEPQVVQDLRAARTFIERGWTTHAQGRDMYGSPTYGNDSIAVQWCLGGAISRATDIRWNGLNPHPRLLAAFDALDRLVPPETPESWARPMYDFAQFNNEVAKDKSDILNLIDRTIAAELIDARGVAHV